MPVESRNRPHLSLPMMTVVDAVQVLIDVRAPEQIVVTNQGAARIWPRLAQHALDLHYNPSTMGGAIPLGLGLALAFPLRRVLVVSGDGALLMSLGSLVTVTSAQAPNLTIVLLNNGRYEVTGGQRTPAADGPVDFAALARAAGFPTVWTVADQTTWKQRAEHIFRLPGPRFIHLKVAPAEREFLLHPSPPIADQLACFRNALTCER